MNISLNINDRQTKTLGIDIGELGYVGRDRSAILTGEHVCRNIPYNICKTWL